MIEFTTITIICILLLIYFRPGKTPPLQNPLVIERAGKYHVTLAPQLNLAQPFIETIAKQIGTSGDETQSSATQYFEVRDKQATAHGHDFYLLAITQRNGMTYFQVNSPSLKNQGDHLHTISEFANKVLARFPTTGSHNTALDEHVVAAALEAARLCGINIKQLTQ